MNPQFMPQQPFAVPPPQGLSSTNRMTASPSPQGVQNTPKPNYFQNKFDLPPTEQSSILNQMPPSTQFGQPPTQSQNIGLPPTSLPNQRVQNGPDLSFPLPPEPHANLGQFSQASTVMHQPPFSVNQSTPLINQAPSAISQGPPLINQRPPIMSQGPPPIMSQGLPPIMSQGSHPTMSQGPPPINQGPPPMNQGATTINQGAPPINQGAPTINRGPPSINQGAPPMNQNPLMAHGPSQISQGPHSMNHGPPPMNQGPPPMSQGPPPMSQGPPPMNQNLLINQGPSSMKHGLHSMNKGPAPMNQLSMPQQQQQNMFNGPPLPNQFQGGQPPPPPLSRQNQFNAPPMPGQPPLPANQFITNQMQDLSLSGPKQYPGGPMRPPVNGDGNLHMPPPVAQQNYMNGQGRPPSYPPMPGQGPMMSGPGGYPQPPYQQQSQQRRLDPDQMPSPIQVMQDDQTTRSGVFCTNQKGLVPPLVTTKFVVQDQGNASPRYVRSTMYNIPITQDLMKQTAVPFGLVISPMARTIEQEYPPPIVNFGELGPVRCIRCKAYMCPYMQFVDSGRRFQCLFCKAATDVPAEYFQHLDHTGQRMDRYERPELVLGTYELMATKDYCRNNTFPNPPAIVFVIDVSYNNIKSGLINLLCSKMKDIIKNLPVDQGMEKSNMKVGFITYNNTVHFYNIKGTLAAPQMMIVGDVQDMFMPLLDGFLCTPEESETVIDALMEQIPIMFGETRETETILLPAILAGLEALKASECTGKLLVFHSSLPIAEAPGKLRNRDDRKLLGTDKERTILTPQTTAYNQLGQDCVGAGCCVDLFLFNNAYIDIATIGQVCRLTGGEVYKYTYFQADIDGDRLITDIITNISRPIAFDGIMRVRTSTGIRPTDFFGHFFMSNTTDMELAAIDCDKAVAVEIKHDDKLTEEEGVYIQVALLYTSCSGQRRLRIINLSLKTCSQMAELYRSCDLDTLVNFFSKQAVYRLLENNPKSVKDNIVTRSAQILANYRKNCASPSSAGQLILPECMKLMPLYVSCLLKSDALSGGSDMTVDDRSFVMQAVSIMDVPNSVAYFYPRLIPLHEVQPDSDLIEMPPQIRCSAEKLADHGVYLLENGIHMLLWIGLTISPEFCQQVFGVASPLQIDVDKIALPKLENPLSHAVNSIIDQIKNERHRCMRLTLVRQREKLEPIFKHFLVEDKGLDNSPSYVDFLCHMHKEIRTILS